MKKYYFAIHVPHLIYCISSQSVRRLAWIPFIKSVRVGIYTNNKNRYQNQKPKPYQSVFKIQNKNVIDERVLNFILNFSEIEKKNKKKRSKQKTNKQIGNPSNLNPIREQRIKCQSFNIYA